MPELSFGQLLGLSGAGAGFNLGTNLVGNTVSGLINNLFYKRNLGLQVEAQKDLINFQNEYNSPSAQMQRLAEAGLNPNLVYGSSSPAGQSGNASAPSANANPGASFNTPDVVASMLHIQQLEQSKAQANALNAEARLKNSEADKNVEYLKVYPELLGYYVRSASQQIDKTASEIDLNKSSNALNWAKNYLSVAETQLKNSEISLNEFRKEQIVAQTMLYLSEAKTEGTKQKYNNQLALESSARTLEQEMDNLYKKYYYGSDGQMKAMSREQRLSEFAKFKKEARVAAAQAGIYGNRFVQWFDWYYGHITKAQSVVQGAEIQSMK